MLRVEYDLANQSYKVTDGDDVTHMSDGYLAQLFTGLQSAGCQLPTDEYLRGKLEATEKHLEDLRRLTFLPNENDKI